MRSKFFKPKLNKNFFPRKIEEKIFCADSSNNYKIGEWVKINILGQDSKIRKIKDMDGGAFIEIEYFTFHGF